MTDRAEIERLLNQTGRTLIDVEDASGRVLYQFQADKLDAFIEELTAIQRNIGQAQPLEMWG